tara:strand:- start:309 stop:797 length:489 start_codon:yes stop_codon:yes gene_type:complete
MAIYTADKATTYTTVEGQEGSQVVSVFIDQAINEESETTFEAKFDSGGMTVTCSKALAKEIGASFDHAASDGDIVGATANAASDPKVANALNQLISLVSGRDIAIATNDLADRPVYRIGECYLQATEELTRAAQANDTKAMKQCQRKMESMNSLKVLASLIS